MKKLESRLRTRILTHELINKLTDYVDIMAIKFFLFPGKNTANEFYYVKEIIFYSAFYILPEINQELISKYFIINNHLFFL
jgi:hypothetical protein